ncbi:hypothetical protein D3C72_709310 [compost metagenome]
MLFAGVVLLDNLIEDILNDLISFLAPQLILGQLAFIKQLAVDVLRYFFQFPVLWNIITTVRHYNTFDYRLNHLKHNFLDVLGFENLAALLVDNFPLLIHHVIILKNDFTHVKVIAFYPFLSGLNGTGNHFALNR